MTHRFVAHSPRARRLAAGALALLVAALVAPATAAAQQVTHAVALASADAPAERIVAPVPAATTTPTPDPLADLPPFEPTLEALRTGPLVQRLLATDGTAFHAAYAAVIVRRPIERVLATIHDVNHYRDFVPRFVQSQELRRAAHSQDLFVRLAVSSVLYVWARVRYHETALPGGAVLIAGHATQGNVDRLDVRWRATPIDGGASTVLEFWTLVVPTLPIPVPHVLLDREQSNVARQGVEALRQRVEL